MKITMQKEFENPYNNVNHPLHYNINTPIVTFKCDKCGKMHKMPLECIEVIRDMPTWKGNAFKYLWRAGLKEDASLSNEAKEIEDLEKAIFYINDKISQIERNIPDND